MADSYATRTLQRALRLLERDGWCQGRMRDDDGRRCASFAIECAATGTKGKDAVREAMAPWSILGRAIDYHFIEPWNDAKGRTKDEVFGAFRRAIVLSRQRIEQADGNADAR